MVYPLMMKENLLMKIYRRMMKILRMLALVDFTKASQELRDRFSCLKLTMRKKALWMIKLEINRFQSEEETTFIR